MSLLTTWGYTITDADALPPMLTDAEFDAMTANKYAGDARISPAISAASAAIRDYSGWHVYPSQACEWKERLLYGNGRIKRTGPDILIQLPAAYVTGVTSVMIGDEPWTDYALATNGIMRLFDVPRYSVDRKTEITVNYTAGLPGGLMAAIKELAAHGVTHALVSPAGIQSETAGGVSVTYAANWINSARASALGDESKDALTPYRLLEVF